MASNPTVARAIVLGSALGDALGAGYEYGCAPLPPVGPCRMIGGGLGNFAPREWTDDTSMAVPVLAAAAQYRDGLDSDAALDDIAAGFLAWHATNPPDVGGHTSAALRRGRALVADGYRPAEALNTAAREYWRTGSVSNGGLMRTNPAVLPYLGDPGPRRAMHAAAAIAALTHAEPASVVPTMAWVALTWAAANGHGPHDAIAIALDALPEPERTYLAGILEPVLADPPASPSAYRPNGNAVQCFQAALASSWALWLADPAGTEPVHFLTAIDRAVKSGADTDTVAAVAGGLAGAIWGLDAAPGDWVNGLHGYPHLTGADLADYAAAATA